jgi:hypothetical protein
MRFKIDIALIQTEKMPYPHKGTAQQVVSKAADTALIPIWLITGGYFVWQIYLTLLMKLPVLLELPTDSKGATKRKE